MPQSREQGFAGDEITVIMMMVLTTDNGQDAENGYNVATLLTMTVKIPESQEMLQLPVYPGSWTGQWRQL